MARPTWLTYANINLTLCVTWAIMLPVAFITRWIYSIAFISAASIYANVATHFAGWRADKDDL